jgi:hypothetical protein
MTLQLAKNLPQVLTDMKGLFSTKRYEGFFGLRRHQAKRELRRVHEAGFIQEVAGSFPRWMPLEGEIAKAPEPRVAPYPPLFCLRLVGEEDKGRAIYEALHDSYNPRRFVVSPEDFREVSNTPFSYWVSNSIRKLFAELPPFESNGRTVRQGLATADDFRFVRLWWEVAVNDLCPPAAHVSDPHGPYCVLGTYQWFPLAKGGRYSPFFDDLHLVVNWKLDGADMKAFSGSVVRNQDFYFRKGLTWPRRTTSGMSVRLLPAGSVFADKGPSAFTELPELYLGLLQSVVFAELVSIQLGAADAAARSYEVGLIQRTPVPQISNEQGQNLVQHALSAVDIQRAHETAKETSHVFHLPACLQVDGTTVVQRMAEWKVRIEQVEKQLVAHQRKINDIAFRLYNIGDADRRTIEVSDAIGASPTVENEAKPDEEVEDEPESSDARQLAADLISYAVGCIYGRWDVRFATGERAEPELPGPFAPLPICAPGSLTGEYALPLHNAPLGYPLRIDAGGLLVDDPDRADDIVVGVHEVFELVCPTDAEARQREVCDLLGVKTLRDYFRKPSAGGFWLDHVKRYSKSRRKAPIYWYLRSSKGNYAIWLYYHRLDKDILFKALLNYVEPKLRFEENNLAQLKQRREAVGTTGREGKQLEKDLDKQESFLSELSDFRYKLKRAADLNLEPDLNDGVVLNIAPLWELVPWKEAEKYWKELIAGKYQWSSIGKQLRERGLVKK